MGINHILKKGEIKRNVTIGAVQNKRTDFSYLGWDCSPASFWGYALKNRVITRKNVMVDMHVKLL